jgi:arylsulfatase A-like enzyme
VARRQPRRRGVWHLLAALVFLAALPLRFDELLGQDLSRVALVPNTEGGNTGPNSLNAGDLRFVVWLVARNAYTLLEQPRHLFDAEPCYPARKALTLGEPGLTLGLLGLPAWAWSGDPLLTFHAAHFAVVWIAAFAMYLLVTAWTDSPVAGLVAGLLYGFHPVKTLNSVHPYVTDTGWTVLALLFATRLLERGRWRDALGLGLAVALQIGGSPYPLLGAAALSLPLAVWLALRFRAARLRPGPALLALAIPALAAVLVFAPYLGTLSEHGDPQRAQFYIAWSQLLPGGRLFPGWTLAGLALAGVVLPLRRPGPGPRFALLAGALLVAWLASGGSEGEALAAAAQGREAPALRLPNLYGALAAWLPGLAAVRVPGSLYADTHLALGALAGLGSAALLSRLPRGARAPAAAALLAAATLAALRPPLPGQTSRPLFARLEVAPAPETLELFRQLDAAGNRGPIFDATRGLRQASEAVLLSAYHHRRTSACSASLMQREAEKLRSLGDELPRPEAVRALADMGFTTLVQRHPAGARGQAMAQRWERQASGALSRLGDAPQRTAWAIAGTHETPPNIVLVISDDHGWPDFGFMGSQRALTPNLDELAREGVVFTHAFDTASSCRPSLATLLSGLSPDQLAAQAEASAPEAGDGPGPAARTRRRVAALKRVGTLPALLGARGYATFQGGKHWEGSYRDAGFSHGVTETTGPLFSGGGPNAKALGRRTMQPLWDFLDAHRNVPFFVWFAPVLPHAPFDASPEYYERHRDAGAAQPYLANVSRLDDRVGELLARIDALGLRERTLVVFLADNGWDAQSPEDDPLLLVMGGAEGKGSIRELGYRTPLVFRWPGVLPGGQRDDRLVSTLDLFPTLLDFAAAPTPPGRLGRSLYPLLMGRGDFSRQRIFGWQSRLRDAGAEAAGRRTPVAGEAWFVRTPRWRSVWYPESGEQQLYRIDLDPLEREDVSDAHPAVTERLRREMEARRRAAQRLGRSGSRAEGS